MSAFLNEGSPNKIRWKRHSCLTDRTQRSAKASNSGCEEKSQTLHAPCCQGLPEFSAELGIAIVQHVATAVQLSDPLQCCIASYLTHPARLRMICDASEGDPPAVQVNEK